MKPSAIVLIVIVFLLLLLPLLKKCGVTATICFVSDMKALFKHSNTKPTFSHLHSSGHFWRKFLVWAPKQREEDEFPNLVWCGKCYCGSRGVNIVGQQAAIGQPDCKLFLTVCLHQCVFVCACLNSVYCCHLAQPGKWLLVLFSCSL